MASSRIFNVRPVLSVNSVRRELLSKPYPVHWSMMHIVYRVLIYRLSIWMRLGVFLASVGSTTGIWSVLIKALKKPQMYFINPPPTGVGEITVKRVCPLTGRRLKALKQLLSKVHLRLIRKQKARPWLYHDAVMTSDGFRVPIKSGRKSLTDVRTRSGCFIYGMNTASLRERLGDFIYFIETRVDQSPARLKK